LRDKLQDKLHSGDGAIEDSPGQGLFGVARSAFTDPEVFEQEMRRIFEGTWVYLAHESQLPNTGDFLVVWIGRKSVVLVRGKDGTIGAFYNACAHRGAEVCRTERGNRKFLVCPYHGWAYDLDGRNINVNEQQSGGYSEGFLARSHDLTPIARFGNYRGFLFGSVSADVAPLEEHLGDASAFIDLLVDQSPQGLEVLKGNATYRYRGNWKLQSENGVDGYHFGQVHQNYVKVLQHRGQRERESGQAAKTRSGFDGDEWGAETGWYDLGNGHAVIWLNIMGYEGRPLWETRDEITARLGSGRADWLLRRQRNLQVFPNVQLMDQNSTQIRVFRPLAVDLTEVRIYCFAPKGESPRARERRIRQYEDFFNCSGMATPDDLAVFESVQAGCNANGGSLQRFDRGLGRPAAEMDARTRALGIRPVAEGRDVQDENIYVGLYREWARLMEKGS
jgi:benzoate/toluate 1,2-dioxygenase alpha subunit